PLRIEAAVGLQGETAFGVGCFVGIVNDLLRTNISDFTTAENVRREQSDLAFDIASTVRHDGARQQTQILALRRSGQRLNDFVPRRLELLQVVRLIDGDVIRADLLDQFEVRRHGVHPVPDTDAAVAGSHKRKAGQENGISRRRFNALQQLRESPAIFDIGVDRENVEISAEEILDISGPRVKQAIGCDDQGDNFLTDFLHITNKGGNVDSTLSGFTAARLQSQNRKRRRVFTAQIRLRFDLVREQ